ncbi:MAG: ATP-binding protein, partial [Holophaga sp.]|nr:ATP-binding protein [Holophaga sp.]
GLGDLSRAKAKLDLLSAQVLEEVRSQRLVTQAERGELALKSSELETVGVLRDCAALVQEHPAAKQKTVSVLPTPEGLRCLADPDLLRRVLVNMTLNALEASPAGATVTLGVQVSAGMIHFQVHNSGCIPLDIQGRLFQRSFSTKATRGRGLGTYSMKLFGETYLGGQVSFHSTPDAGTTFELALPFPHEHLVGG